MSLVTPMGSWSSGPTSARFFPSQLGHPVVWLRKVEPCEGDMWTGGRWDVLFLGHLPVVRPLSSGKKYRNANFQKIPLVWSNTFRPSTYHLALGSLSLSLSNPYCLHIGRDMNINRGSLSIFHPATNKQSVKFQGKTSLFLKSLASEI